MTRIPVTCRDLEDARKRLIRQVQRDLTLAERRFLVSLKQAEPQWELIPIAHLAEMPAIRWKLRNLEQLARQPRRHEAAVRRLREVLNV